MHKHAAAAVALLQRAQRASAVELHTTLIRNEHAYFICIAQLLVRAPQRCDPHLPVPCVFARGEVAAGALFSPILPSLPDPRRRSTPRHTPRDPPLQRRRSCS